MEVSSCDERALRLSPSLKEGLEEALKKGMKLGQRKCGDITAISVGLSLRAY